jgi:microcystin-dependent protein
MANHSHTHNGTAAANFAGSGGLQGAQATVALTINATGGGTAFNVLQPTIILNYIIKV